MLGRGPGPAQTAKYSFPIPATKKTPLFCAILLRCCFLIRSKNKIKTRAYRKESSWLHLWMAFESLRVARVLNTIPLLELTVATRTAFVQHQHQVPGKAKLRPLPSQAEQTPNSRQAGIGWSLYFCARTRQSDVFIAKCCLEKMQNKIAKLQKEEKGGGGETKGPLPFAYWVQRHNMQHPAANGKLH